MKIFTKVYQLELRRGGMICREIFMGNFIGLTLYRLKMRKWEIIVK